MANKMKVLISLAVLFGLTYTQAINLESFNVNRLRRQNFYYSMKSNWIPPSPSNEGCVLMGCCLFPLGGCLIGREALKKEERPESLQSIKQPKFSIGISYSPGIAYTGIQLSGPFPTTIGPTPEAFFAHFYLNNKLEIDARYYFNSRWALGIGGGYMWARLNARNPWFYPKGLLEGESWGIWDKSRFWEITTFSWSACLLYYRVNRKCVKYIGGGLEYNLSEGLAHGKWSEWSEQYPSEIIESLEGNALRWGRGMGSFFNIGFARLITKNVSFNVSLTVRYSLAKEYKWELPSWAVLDKPINYNFTGLYPKIGFSYVLFKQQTKKEEY